MKTPLALMIYAKILQRLGLKHLKKFAIFIESFRVQYFHMDHKVTPKNDALHQKNKTYRELHLCHFFVGNRPHLFHLHAQ